MNDEKFSALIDSELTRDEAATLIDQMCADETLAAQWERQHTSAAAVAGIPVLSDDSFSKRVMAQVEQVKQEAAAISTVPMAEKTSWFASLLQPRWAAGMAAAVVALVVGALYQSGQQAAPADVDQVVNQEPDKATNQLTVASASSPSALPASGARFQQASFNAGEGAARPAGRQLNGYLMDYNALHSAHRMKGALGYARVAAYTGTSAH